MAKNNILPPPKSPSVVEDLGEGLLSQIRSMDKSELKKVKQDPKQPEPRDELMAAIRNRGNKTTPSSEEIDRKLIKTNSAVETNPLLAALAQRRIQMREVSDSGSEAGDDYSVWEDKDDSPSAPSKPKPAPRNIFDTTNSSLSVADGELKPNIEDGSGIVVSEPLAPSELGLTSTHPSLALGSSRPSIDLTEGYTTDVSTERVVAEVEDIVPDSIITNSLGVTSEDSASISVSTSETESNSVAPDVMSVRSEPNLSASTTPSVIKVDSLLKLTPPKSSDYNFRKFQEKYEKQDLFEGGPVYLSIIKELELGLQIKNPGKRTASLISAVGILDGYCHPDNKISSVVLKQFFNLFAELNVKDEEFQQLLKSHAPEFCKRLGEYCKDGKGTPELVELSKELEALVHIEAPLPITPESPSTDRSQARSVSTYDWSRDQYRTFMSPPSFPTETFSEYDSVSQHSPESARVIRELSALDLSSLNIISSSLMDHQDALLKLDDLSIPGIVGNVTREEMKRKFPDKANDIDQLSNLPINFYDEKGLAILQKQINDASDPSLLRWDHGSCQAEDREGHEALISYTFDGTNYRAIVAQDGRVSVNFVSFEYMLQQSRELENIKNKVTKEISNGKFDDLPLGAEAGTKYTPAKIEDVNKIALNTFYQSKLKEIKEATNVVVANTIDNLDRIYRELATKFEDHQLLESLIFSPALAPINLDGLGGYSIARETKDGKTNIRINCISGEDGKFKDNVMYVNVTGTNHYVKVQVARENGETIDGQPRREGDIVILEGLYKETKAEGKMSQTEMEALSQVDQDAIANCNIVANAVIRSRELGDKVKISSAVKFQGQIANQEVKEETKTEVLIDVKKQNKQKQQKKVANKTPPNTSRSGSSSVVI